MTATVDTDAMGSLRELLAIDHRQALEFFVVHLQDISEPTVNREELIYNASVLAHYAQVSTYPGTDVPTPANLSAVFDHFVADTTVRRDAAMMESLLAFKRAGADGILTYFALDAARTLKHEGGR